MYLSWIQEADSPFQPLDWSNLLIFYTFRFMFLSMNLTDAPIGSDVKFMMSVPPWCNLFDYCKPWQFRFEPLLSVNIYLIAAQYQLFSPPSLECILDMCLYILRLGLWFHVIYAYLTWRTAHFIDLFQLLQGHPARLKHWILMGFALLISGIILHFTHGVNWTLSMCNFIYYLLSPCFLIFSQCSNSSE